MSPHTLDTLDLPADIVTECRSLKQARAQDRLARLYEIGTALTAKRKDAVDYRVTTGIEEVWTKAEEAYNSIDDANRHEYAHAKWAKPLTVEGPVTKDVTGNKSGRSTVFVPMTARYMLAGQAKVAEILLPPDDKAFSFVATPVPELIDARQNEEQVTGPDGTPLQRDPRPDELPGQQSPAASPLAAPASAVSPATTGAAGGPLAPGAPPLPPEQQPGVPLTVKDLAQEAMDHASTAATKAEKRVADWMIEGKFRSQTRKVIGDAAKLGVGILKGPYPVVKRRMATKRVKGDGTGDTIEVSILRQIIPGFKAVSPWNFFPDKSCGEDPQNGDYCFERDFLSGRQLRALRNEQDLGYIPSQIDDVLKEGPQKRFHVERPTSMAIDDERFEVWYFTGQMTRDEFLFLNPPKLNLHDPTEGQDSVHVVATLVNDRVVRAVLNSLEVTGDLNYHAISWTLRDGYWAGVGIPEQMHVAQRIVNGATRAMMDNAGKSAGPVVIIDTDCVTPSDNVWEIAPWKIFFKGASATIDDVRKAFAHIEFPDRQTALQAVADYGFRLAEESTNIPLITQGLSGDTTPDTLGATQLQDNNANQLLRAVGYAFDESIIEPVVNELYEWLLLDPDVPADEKGDFDINAHGSSALVERAIQGQWLAQQANIVKDPAFGVNPRKWYAEYAMSNRMDPKRIQFTEDELAKIDSQPPQKPPVVQSAEIKAQVDLQKAQLDTDRDRAYVQAETQRTEMEMQMQLEELTLKREIETLRRDLEILKMSNARGITVEQIKADLASDAMKLRAQKDMAAQDRVGEVLTPPTEPAGRAPKGQSFEK